MRTQQAELFLIVAELQSVSAAARRLGKSRSTVSTSLSAFEEELGAELFERTGNQLRLTPIGAAIRSDCQRLVQASRQIHHRCRHHLEGVESGLRIARDDALPEAFWRDTLSALNERFPLTGISVYLAPPQDLPDLVHQHSVDMALGLDVRDVYPNELSVNLLGEFPVLTVAAPTHPLHQLAQASPDDLDQYREITMAYLHNNTLVAEHTSAASYQAMTMFELIRDAVIAGTGWARLPGPLIEAALAANRLTAFTHRDTISSGRYVALSETGALHGPVTTWLINRVEAYLGGRTKTPGSRVPRGQTAGSGGRRPPAAR
ncbi:LysR family transcriptional regulator [Marinobacter sp. X15-166B]|uniref:LysR family transcriptional regulator n=1 Tax=Marinobacter sp. X15-166B TaxID=1897620 RepID=UPI00085C8433|nr:LysR family transcriptional regulator [Marinobacter sp. X15-166B]OEY66606.1 hypothetical protein BG841_09165 [Marinobacter sp. X15-166B]